MTAVEFASIFEDSDGTLQVAYDDDVTAPINPRDLRDAGWKPDDENDPCEQDHCGTDDCSCGDLSIEALAILEDWHNGAHDGVFRFCAESPCKALGAL